MSEEKTFNIGDKVLVDMGSVYGQTITKPLLVKGTCRVMGNKTPSDKYAVLFNGTEYYVKTKYMSLVIES